MTCRKIVVTNVKGGCGKSTIACNIAAYYAQQGLNVSIYDHDKQGSSLDWLERRQKNLPRIRGIDASKKHELSITRSWFLRQSPDLDVAITDTPAGIEMEELFSLFQDDESVIIPVLPSPVDIQTTEKFIEKLIRHQHSFGKNIRLAVVANRMRKNTLMSRKLEGFLSNLGIPFSACLRDTQFYVQAFDIGAGIHDLSSAKLVNDQRHWRPLFRWLEKPYVEPNLTLPIQATQQY